LNALYPSFKDQLLTKQFSWLGDTLAVALYDVLAIYVPTDSNISEIAGTQIAPGDPIANKTVVDGYAGSFPSVYTGLLNPLEVATAIIYRVSDGALVAYLDTVDGFTFKPTGANYTLTPGGPGGTYFAL